MSDVLSANSNYKRRYPPQSLPTEYLKSGDLFLNDSGAETSMGYAGDLTRTFPVDNTFTTKQKRCMEVVLNAFNNAQQLLKPELNLKIFISELHNIW